ncbi:MAG: hypothetical protein ACKVOY_21880 [Burkholderiaceae bacterium]
MGALRYRLALDLGSTSVGWAMVRISLQDEPIAVTSNDQIVTTLWTNVVGSTPSAADKAPFIKMLTDGMAPGALAHLAADTTFNTINIGLTGLAQTGIEFTPV